MIRRTGIAALATLVASALAGCAGMHGATQDSTVSTRPHRGYLAARGMDLLDIASLRVGAGPGLLVHARITPYVALGMGEIGSVAAAKPGFTLDVYELGWIKREGGLWTERRVELGISTFYYLEVEAEPIAGDRITFGEAARHPWDVGFDVHLAILGAAAEVRLDEIVDFVAGIFGGDPLDDDALPSITTMDSLSGSGL